MINSENDEGPRDPVDDAEREMTACQAAWDRCAGSSDLTGVKMRVQTREQAVAFAAMENAKAKYVRVRALRDPRWSAA